MDPIPVQVAIFNYFAYILYKDVSIILALWMITAERLLTV